MAMNRYRVSAKFISADSMSRQVIVDLDAPTAADALTLVRTNEAKRRDLSVIRIDIFGHDSWPPYLYAALESACYL